DGWRTALRAGNLRDRNLAVIALGHFGQAAKAAVPDLIELVRQGPFKDEALDALVRIGAGAEVTVPTLIQRFVAQGRAHLPAMGAIGADRRAEGSLVRIGRPAVPALIGVLNGPNLDMRVCAAEALGEIGPAARAAIPALIRALAADRRASDP